MEVRDHKGQVTGRYAEAHACALAISRAIEDTETPEQLQHIWQNNNAVITILQKQAGSPVHAGGNGRPGASGTSTAPIIDLAAAYNRRCEILSGEAQGKISKRA